MTHRDLEPDEVGRNCRDWREELEALLSLMKSPIYVRARGDLRRAVAALEDAEDRLK